MTLADDPWLLPSAGAFLGEIQAAVYTGALVVETDLTTAPGMVPAIRRSLEAMRWRAETLTAVGGRPADELGEYFGLSPRLDRFIVPELDQTIVVVSFGPEADGEAWRLFAERFEERRSDASAGLTLMLLDPPWREPRPKRVIWGGRLRRIDTAIWTDLHAPPDRPEPLAALAAALGIELCGWRLDLAAAIARAAKEDLVNPLGWLGRSRLPVMKGVPRFAGRVMPCPLALHAAGKQAELQLRIWRAELSALFPWLEALRQTVIDRYHTRLRVDEHLRSLGVTDVADMELGAITSQLDWSGTLSREEMATLRALRDIRNALAHRTPANPVDLLLALRMTAGWLDD